MVDQDHWIVFVFYSSHTEQGKLPSARKAQEHLAALLSECDPGFATGMIVEMKSGDQFPAQNAPEDRRGYFVLDESGAMRMISREEVYNLARAAYSVRAGKYHN